MSIKHFLRITDLDKKKFENILNISLFLKNELKRKGKNKAILKDKTMAMIFEKPSLRTRISFEIAMTQLGGHAIYLGPTDIQMGKRETPGDIGIVTSSMADIIMARTFRHQDIDQLALKSSVPVINALSDLEHPCQILADFLTILEKKGRINNLKIVYFGDGNNNVAHSLALASAILGSDFYCVAPQGYQLNKKIYKQALNIANKTKSKIVQTQKSVTAVKNADVIVTDTWISMGDEAEKQKRLKVFPKYQVNSKLMSKAKKNAIFMHCLPAYRGKEVSSEVIDGPHSVVFQEAENRLHAQKGLLAFLFKGGKNE
jgi:ornithine carbamoyltransferase